MRSIPNEPFQEVAVDFYGPMVEDGKHLMVVTDLYFRYPEVTVINSVAGKHVIPEIEIIFKRFGFPKLLRSDNGAPFNGQEWDKFNEKFNIKKELTTPYHHQSNAVVERFMQNLTTQRRFAKTTGKHYKEMISNFLASYRSTPHISTGQATAKLIFKYAAHLTRLPRPKSDILKDEIMLNAEYSDKEARLKMKTNKEKTGKFIERDFNIDDMVRVKNVIKQPKNVPPFSTDTYKITDIRGSKITAENNRHQITRDDSCFKKVVCSNINSKQESSSSDSDSDIQIMAVFNKNIKTRNITQNSRILIPRGDGTAMIQPRASNNLSGRGRGGNTNKE